ncbi:uncharacterized protein LOC141592242 [Silene latifolia]|uniref:uncharacterized protein LOC141592242 n=1 Tax=Silene latifolia TaxID=37657 RepID=UPI003D7744B9
MSAFGNPNNLAPNSLAVNRGNESMSAFGNMTNSTHNPFVVNTSGNASMSVPGIPYNPASNLFASNTNGNASVSVFGNPSNPTPNPFALDANGNASKSIFGNPTNPPPNPCAFNTNGNASMSAFGNSSNPPSNPFDGTSTGAFGGQPFSVLFGVTQASTGMIKGSKSVPYAATKNAENSIERFLSISSMPVYQSKSHEELRWEDYELKSRGISHPFGPQSVSSHPLTLTHNGISCMPVIDKPETTRISPRRPPRTSRR